MANDLTVPDAEMTDQQIEDFNTLIAAKITAYTDLIPWDRLQSLRQHVTAQLRPIGKKGAVEHVKVLMGAYTRHTVADPKTYTQMMVALVAEYPAIAIKTAIDEITRKSRWLPERADMAAALEEEIGHWRTIKARIDCSLHEHVRRQDEARREQLIKEERAAFRAKHGDKSPLDVLREEQEAAMRGARK